MCKIKSNQTGIWKCNHAPTSKTHASIREHRKTVDRERVLNARVVVSSQCEEYEENGAARMGDLKQAREQQVSGQDKLFGILFPP